MSMLQNVVATKREKGRPFITWPTTTILLFSWSLFLVSTYNGITEYWHPILVILTNCICAYLAYSVVHEASHALVSRSPLINDLSGQAAQLLLTPTLGFYLYRKVHAFHHRYTNHSTSKDPDLWLGRGPIYLLILKWIAMDGYYAYFYARHLQFKSMRNFLWGALALLSSGAFFTTVVYMQWLGTFLLYVFLPSRLTNMFLSWTFAYLPHAPHRPSPSNNPYETTRLIPGFEKSLSWFLLGHNYHLVHHLHPDIPFFRYRQTWLQRKQCLAQETRTQHSQ